MCAWRRAGGGEGGGGGERGRGKAGGRGEAGSVGKDAAMEFDVIRLGVGKLAIERRGGGRREGLLCREVFCDVVGEGGGGLAQERGEGGEILAVPCGGRGGESAGAGDCFSTGLRDFILGGEAGGCGDGGTSAGGGGGGDRAFTFEDADREVAGAFGASGEERDAGDGAGGHKAVTYDARDAVFERLGPAREFVIDNFVGALAHGDVFAGAQVGGHVDGTQGDDGVALRNFPGGGAGVRRRGEDVVARGVGFGSGDEGAAGEAEDGCQKTKDRGQRTVSGGQRTEDGGRRTVGGGRRTVGEGWAAVGWEFGCGAHFVCGL